MRDKDKQILADRYIDLYAIAYALLHNDDDARDAVQEALAVTMAFPLLRDPYRFCGRVLRNICYKHLGRSYILVKSPPETPVDTPDGEYENRLVWLETAKKHLSAETVKLLDMHFVEGLTLKEISKTTGRPLPALKKQFSQTYSKLRIEMNKLETQQKDL